jgi:APA family basic amino acid/polyamine antiporter
MSLFNAAVLVVGNVVGAGIYTTAGMLASQVAHPAVFVGVWVLGGLLTLVGALTYAELGAMFPRAGGDYQFLKEAYGPLAGFALGWIGQLIIFPASVAALSIALVGHIPGLPPIAGSIRWYALPLILTLGFINYRSTRLSCSTQSVVTIGNLVLLLSLVVGGVLFGHGNTANFLPSSSSSISFTGSAMIAVFFTYSGWFAAVYVGSEVVRPERNVPLALIFSTLFVTLLYTAVNATYLYAIPLSDMRAGDMTNAAEVATLRLFGPGTAWLVAAAIALAILSCMNAALLTGARVGYAMAQDGVFFKKLGEVHPKFSTPHLAVAVQTALAITYVALGSFEKLLGCVVFAMLLSNTATGIAHIKLRISKPSLPRPYRTPLYPVLPILFAAVHAWFAVSIAASNPITSLIGTGIVLTAIPVYFIRKRLSLR